MKLITESKIFQTIETYIANDKKRFIIYPYGSKGKMLEKVLKESFHIQDYVLADNYQNRENILPVVQLDAFAEDHVLLICSDNPESYWAIREGLREKFHGEICDLAETEVERYEYEPFHFENSKMVIEETDERQIRHLFERTKRAWEKLGNEEPYFSVITHDEMRTENLTAESISQFFQSGAMKAIEVINSLERNAVSGHKSLSILELGCGCGRVTKSLAQNFKHVYAVDISEGNLKIAREHISSENVDFLLVKEVEDYITLPPADVIYSVIVLQHNCPPVIEYILNILMQKVNPGGILMFQIPTYDMGYSFVYETYMQQPEKMEMHCFPQQRIFQLAYRNQCIPLEAYPYLCTGRTDHSTMFLFRKQQAG